MTISYEELFKFFEQSNNQHNNYSHAITIKNNGQKVAEYCFQDGIRFNNEGGPSIKHFYKGQLSYEAYYVDDKLTRDNGPAQSYFNPNGDYALYWHKNNLRHNDNGPAIVRCYSGELTLFWYQFDKLHNNDGPAYVRYNLAGTPVVFEFFIDGKNYNPKGPSIVKYNDNFEEILLSQILN